MSDQLAAMRALVASDEDFAAQLRGTTSAADVIALAAKNGITLTEADLTPPPAEGDLSDADLEASAGGACFLSIVETIAGYSCNACSGFVAC